MARAHPRERSDRQPADRDGDERPIYLPKKTRRMYSCAGTARSSSMASTGASSYAGARHVTPTRPSPSSISIQRAVPSCEQPSGPGVA